MAITLSATARKLGRAVSGFSTFTHQLELGDPIGATAFAELRRTCGSSIAQAHASDRLASKEFLFVRMTLPTKII